MKKLYKILLFTLVFSFLMAVTTVASATDIRVLLSNITYTDVFVASGEYKVTGGSVSFDCTKGDKISVNASNGTVTVSKNGERKISGVNAVYINEKGNALNLLKHNNVMYRGNAIVFGKGYLVNKIDIEEYLYGVICKELGYSYQPLEALKAQAVASRSFAAYNISSSNTYYDINKSSQVYGGYSAEANGDCTKVYQAVKETKGKYAYFDGKLVQAFFSANAGGYTENNDNVWGSSPVAYLRAVPSTYDNNGTSSYSWTVTYTPEQMKNLAEKYMKSIGKSGTFGTFKELRLYYDSADGSGPTKSGRAIKASIIGTGATVTATKNNVRSLLGVKSTLISVNGSSASNVSEQVYVKNGYGNTVKTSWKQLYAGDGKGIVQLLSSILNPHVSTATKTYALSSSGNSATGNVVINGKGYGHGVGMSQHGAIGMAKAGYTYDQILKHYYGGNNPGKFSIITK